MGCEQMWMIPFISKYRLSNSGIYQGVGWRWARGTCAHTHIHIHKYVHLYVCAYMHWLFILYPIRHL